MRVNMVEIRKWSAAALILVVVMLFGSVAASADPWLLETQLAGVRLGDHIINYFGHKDGHPSTYGVRTWYGTPTGIVVATGGAPTAPLPTAAAAAGAAAAGAAGPVAAVPTAPGAGVPGAFAAPGYQGGARPYAAPGAAVPAGVSGMTGAAISGSSYEGLEYSPALTMPSAGMAAFQAGERREEKGGGGGAGPAAVGPRPAAARPAAGAAQPAGAAVVPPPQAFGTAAVPIWAMPIWFDLRTDAYGQPEVEYIYYKGGDVVVGIVCDSRGYITAVAVAGRECGFARTAMGDPKRTIELGDGFKTVIYRYGYPDRIETFNGGGATTPFSGSVSFQGTTNVFERDCILYYDQQTPDGKEKNVAFTLHDLQVTRIHIWIPTAY